jgi:hypothetical protein
MHSRSALRAVQARPIRLPSRTFAIQHLPDLKALVGLLYSACFVVISHSVGARASEILTLRAGCVIPNVDDASSPTGDIVVIVGSIYKNESRYHGRRHEWVAPPPAIHAISVLEALSEPHRARSRRDD